MAIELVPLGTLRVQLKPPIDVGAGPAGTRMIFEVESVEMKGERLCAEMTGVAAADWFLIDPAGTGTMDIRATLSTDDGAVIYTHYYGRSDLSGGMNLPATIYVAPRFETGDERYAWLNRILAIGKGIINEDLSIDYEWYEVR